MTKDNLFRRLLRVQLLIFGVFFCYKVQFAKGLSDLGFTGGGLLLMAVVSVLLIDWGKRHVYKHSLLYVHTGLLALALIFGALSFPKLDANSIVFHLPWVAVNFVGYLCVFRGVDILKQSPRILLSKQILLGVQRGWYPVVSSDLFWQKRLKLWAGVNLGWGFIILLSAWIGGRVMPFSEYALRMQFFLLAGLLLNAALPCVRKEDLPE